MRRSFQNREELEGTISAEMNTVLRNLNRYSLNELLNLHDVLIHMQSPPSQQQHRHGIQSHPVLPRMPIHSNSLFSNDMFNSRFPFNRTQSGGGGGGIMNGLNLTNSINNRDVGFEMVTTVSATSPMDLPDSLLAAIQNIIGDVAMETQTMAMGTGNWVGEDVHVALPKECIRMMPSKRFKKEPQDECIECTICFDTFEKNERYRELPCKHIFHKRCVDKWFEKSVHCPMCRQDVRDTLQINNSNNNDTPSNNDDNENIAPSNTN